MISSGGPVTESTRRVLVGMGLELREGYGLTESASLLSVSSGGARAKPGAVGRAIPGVELRIESPDAQGYGEILARGPNVMTGYFSPISGAPRPVDAEGWLHTGDLGRLDAKGNLELAGRLEGSSVSSASESTPVFSAPTAFRSSSLS